VALAAEHDLRALRDRIRDVLFDFRNRLVVDQGPCVAPASRPGAGFSFFTASDSLLANTS